MEELRSYECWSLLTSKLLDSKLINSVCSVVNFDSTADLRKEKIMKKVFTMSILIFLIFLVAGGCKQKTRRIITGEPVVVTTETIGPEGGTITINKEGDPLNGYSITVPEGAYAESQSFTVSYRPILNHTYGENFNPIAPLITVENGGGYAKKSMVVKIPVEVPEGHFAMAFFYDDKTGELQGVSMRKSEKNLLTVATKHFSNMAVSSAAKKVFEGEIPSGFKQGVDNWQFTNWGSYVAVGGQCAGQTIAAMYYYSEKKVKEKKPSLFGLYDNYNNPYQKTPDIEFDDVLAYRLCSMVQEDLLLISTRGDGDNRSFSIVLRCLLRKILTLNQHFMLLPGPWWYLICRS